MSDVLLFIGDFNDAVKVLVSAQETYKDAPEIEYRLSGLSFTLNNEDKAFTHLINGMKLDYEYHIIIKDLFPLVFVNLKVQELLSNYKKAME